MTFKHEASGIAASVFLACYTFYTITALYIYVRQGWKHIYTFLLMFGIIRLASQLCAVVFAAVGLAHWQWLVAYLVLGAEGYFTLIYTSMRFICDAQKKAYGISWVMSTAPKFKSTKIQKFCSSYLKIFHLVLIPANVLIIAGGSLLSGVDSAEYSQLHHKVTIARILRTIGQSIFLALTPAMILLNLFAYYKERIRNHFTISIFLASPFLLVRGIFGILSIYVKDMNRIQLSNYINDGVTSKYVIYEYVLGTTMEFVAGTILISNYFLAQRKNKILREATIESTASKELTISTP
ncbi:hypothetical protein HG535_0G03140 [Zygotorulaspora mrakii]|uniref:DUF7702 domain-containing protein n=1 Tax=Zygotorulaspora mrakii TaxID=42260 RepID=A0A7H9B6W4_ZYGMR|nr:uncharacterized protein HG535_0G03140 [Zygotorulaspora mrakii]QLG74431.1 hypothetical protein HG535_0G03140 [Zygotorulaspora mrakii]